MLFLILTGLFFSSCTHQSSETEIPYVILVSFDGFSHEYISRYDLPNFTKIANEGVIAESLIPSFPSKTFPNHYTIVTGLYPGNHGLVDNSFYDPDKKVIYTMGNRALVEDPFYYGGTPLWQLLQEHGLKAASYFWVGSEAPVKGTFPDYYLPYDNKTPNEERISRINEWLRLPESSRPHFITIYFSLVDTEGHKSGPYSEDTKQSVLEADRLLGILVEQLNKSGLPFNLIITSDHGMYELKNDPENFIYLDQILPKADSGLTVVNNSTHTHIYFSDKEDIESFYKKIIINSEKYDVFRKEETPEKWHYRNNSRIGDLLVVAKPGFVIRNERKANMSIVPQVTGQHGYDPYVTPEMGGVFLAYGKNIATGKQIPSFENVHIYPLIAKILNLKIPPIDGREEVLENIYCK